MRARRTLALVCALILSCCPLLTAQDEQGLFSDSEPYRTGHLQVSELHEIYYECSGDPEGTPVMCLHGGPGVGSYPRLRRYFDPDRFHVILHDQRGTARSRPFGELRGNTTWDLVQDIEALREHLGLEQVILFGGSWGSTLALAYAQTHPERVSGLILRGVFLGTEEEIEFHYSGAGRFFPVEHQALLDVLPDPSRGTHPDHLYELIRGEDEQLRDEVLRALAAFELKFMKLSMPDERVAAYLDAWPAEPHRLTASLDLHYVTNRYFLEPGQLMRDMQRIEHIPAVLIHGRYDMATAPRAAFDVHRALPRSRLVIVEQAGHSETEVGNTAALLEAVRGFE